LGEADIAVDNIHPVVVAADREAADNTRPAAGAEQAAKAVAVAHSHADIAQAQKAVEAAAPAAADTAQAAAQVAVPVEPAAQTAAAEWVPLVETPHLPAY